MRTLSPTPPEILTQHSFQVEPTRVIITFWSGSSWSPPPPSTQIVLSFYRLRLNLKGNQPQIFIGRTDAKAEVLTLWPPDAKSRLIGRDFDVEKDWAQEEKRATKDKMVGWHHQLNGHEFEQTPGKSGVLQSMGSQRVGHNRTTEKQLKEFRCLFQDCI